MKVDNDHMNTARDKITLPLYRLAAVAPITYNQTVHKLVYYCVKLHTHFLKFNSNYTNSYS